mgnify:CR=1 FL=1
MNKHILVVEDSEIQATQLKDLLEEYGYQVTVATNGQKGLEAAYLHKPDLIITDLVMPVMDGFEMCRAIKHDGTLKDIPVMLVTVLSELDEVIQALKAGADYFLAKPYHEKYLLSRVAAALTRPVRKSSEGAEGSLEVVLDGQRHIITSDCEQMLNLLLSTYENAICQNRKLLKAQRELQKLNEELQREIAEHQQTEEELKRLKEFNESIVQNMAEGIVVEDAWGRITFVNPAAAAMLGYSTDELIGKHWTAIVPAEQHPSVQEAYERHKHGTTDRYELQVIRKDGSRIPVMVSSTPRIEDGRYAGTLAVFTDITKYKQVESELQHSLRRLRSTFDEAIHALASAMRFRDPYTAIQQRRVTQLAVAIAEEMGLPDEQIEGLRVAAAVYDIGKINVPIELLSDPEGLTDLEYGIIKAHPQVGYEVLKEVRFPWPVAEIVLQHHERMDGSGYPQGLKGDEIMLEARILAVADVVVAMASRQPYRSALGIESALEEISRNRGTLYDRNVVGACLKLFRQKGFKFNEGVRSPNLPRWQRSEQVPHSTSVKQAV